MSIVTNTALKAALQGVASAVEDQLFSLYNPNLLLGTTDLWTESDASPLKVALAEDIEEGEMVTLSFDVELGAGNKNFLIYNSGWYGNLDTGYLNPVNGRVCISFPWKYPTQGEVNKELWLQRRPAGVNTPNLYKCMKLERGTVATRWCCAAKEVTPGRVEELESKVKVLQTLADLTAVSRVMSVGGIISYPNIQVLGSRYRIDEITNIEISEDDYFVFTLMVTDTLNGTVAGTKVTCFDGAEVFGRKVGNVIYPADGCVLIDRSNGSISCMVNGTLKEISG